MNTETLIQEMPIGIQPKTTQADTLIPDEKGRGDYTKDKYEAKDISESELIQKVNKVRESRNVPPLKLN